MTYQGGYDPPHLDPFWNVMERAGLTRVRMLSGYYNQPLGLRTPHVAPLTGDEWKLIEALLREYVGMAQAKTEKEHAQDTQIGKLQLRLLKIAARLNELAKVAKEDALAP